MTEVEAYLSNDKEYTSFTCGDTVIRFLTPARLEKYINVLSWDDGYIEVIAKYKGIGEVEEYIDLNPILDNLYINRDEFLKPIEKVSVRYA